MSGCHAALRLLSSARSAVGTSTTTKFLNSSVKKSIQPAIVQQHYMLPQRFLSTTNTWCSGRRYTDKHEWVLVDADIGLVGISNYAQEALGDVVFAQLPDVGTQLTQKDECGALESVKAASELFSPITGSVVEKNTAVEDTPSLVNSSCYDKGWLFKVKIANNDEIKSLMNETQYEEYLKGVEH